MRTEGKGRVFYTAYGHDRSKAWGNPGFADLIERGIRWAVGKGEVFDSRPKVASGLKPFEYRKRASRHPQLSAWPTLGHPGRSTGQIQKPLDPAESMKHLVLPRASRPSSLRVNRKSQSRYYAWLGIIKATLDRRKLRLPQQQAARPAWQRPNQNLRRHRWRRQSRQVHRLRR